MAESAVIGRRTKSFAFARSMITTWFCSPTVSRTQMNLSDSIVRVLKPMLAALMPRLWSWEKNQVWMFPPVAKVAQSAKFNGDD